MWCATALRAFLAAIFFHAAAIDASPRIAYPVNSQVPPVAYASQNYEFTFAPNTFSGDSVHINYSISDQPSWLSLDGPSRTFSGQPTGTDVGATTFQLIASDATGQSSSSVTLVVLEDHGPELENPLLPQLSRAGQASAPESLLLYPLEEFTLSFTKDTFSGTSQSSAYYAISTDNTPLPSWIQFDASVLSFSGLSPPLVSSSTFQEVYGIKLIASNVVGFGQAVAQFNIVVGHHKLSFSQTVQTIDVTIGSSVTIPPLRTALRLDGNSVSSFELERVQFVAPGWLSVNQEEISLSGIVGVDATDTAISITATDIYGDIASTLINLRISSPQTSLGKNVFDANATAGDDFDFTLPFSDHPQLGPPVVADVANASTWLTFTPSNLSFHGHVPSTLSSQTVYVAITITNDTATTAGLLLIYVSKAMHASSTYTGSTSATVQTSRTANPTMAATNAPDSPRAKSSRRRIVIVLGVFLSIIVVAIFMILFYCCRRRRRRSRVNLATVTGLTPRMSDQGERQEMSRAADVAPVVAETHYMNERSVTPTGPPRVQLPWAPDSLQKSKDRLSRRAQTQCEVSFDSSWSGLVPPEPKAGKEALAIAYQGQPEATQAQGTTQENFAQNILQSRPALATLQYNQTLSPNNRASKGLSTMPPRSVGLLQRMSGAGHGAFIPGLSANDSRSSQQTTIASVPKVGSRPSTVVLDAFPAPAIVQSRSPMRSPAKFIKSSLRIVEDEDEESESLEVRRQRWHTKRARERLEGVARFSNAGSARTPSVSRLLAVAGKSPGRATPSTLHPFVSPTRPVTMRSWSQWSGIGPAAHAEPVAQGRGSGFSQLRTPFRPKGTISAASSHQFDSALSSLDSDWEDENLMMQQNEHGERHWQNTRGYDERGTPSPRLPFESYANPHERLGEGSPVAAPRRARLPDRRKHISVEDSETQRSQKSYRGSFRFI